MVEPTAPAVTFTVSGAVLADVESAYRNFRDALHGVVTDCTPAHKRSLAAARRGLADAYHELGRQFSLHVEVSSALVNHAYGRLLDQADEDEECAASMEDPAAGGDVA